MADSVGNGPTLDLLQPELMSTSQLIQLLEQRRLNPGKRPYESTSPSSVMKKITLSELECLTHEALVDLYYKIIMPLPQRKYRSNRRGRVAAQQQIAMNTLNRKRSHDKISSQTFDSAVDWKRTEKDSSNSRFLCSFTLPPTKRDRLKPPPVNVQHKIIRLRPTSSSLSPDSTQSPKSGIIKLKTSNSSPNSGPQVPGLVSKNSKFLVSSSRTSVSESETHSESKDIVENAAAMARAEAAQNPNVMVKCISSGGTLVKITPSKPETGSTLRKKIRLNRVSFSSPTSAMARVTLKCGETEPMVSVADKSQGQSSPVADKSQGQSSPVADKSQGQSSPVADKSQGQSSPVADKGKGRSSPVADKGQGQSSPVADKSQGQSSPVADKGKGQSSPVADKGQGQSSPVADKGQGQSSPVADKRSEQSSREEDYEVARKKFKSVSIKWP